MTQSYHPSATVPLSLPVGKQASTKPYRPLRVMIVDDNHINLQMLARLLKRKFSHVVDGEPVTVDSALKAIQLLQQRVFDVILMDIQMPFLNGLEATMRIRNGEDGILAANSTAHVVAVTTAVGDEPEAAYRRAGMDGMIGKPVRQQDIEVYLNSLSQVAHQAFGVTQPMHVDGVDVAPPLPPTLGLVERAFYIPADATIRSPVDEICADSDFERALHSQTIASLQQCGLIASRAAAGGALKDMCADTDSGAASNGSSERGSDGMERPRHLRGASLSLQQFGQQIAREIANIDNDGHRLSPPLTHRSLSRLPKLSMSQCPSSPFVKHEYVHSPRSSCVISPSSDDAIAEADDNEDDGEGRSVDDDTPPLCSSSELESRRASDHSTSSEATSSDYFTDIPTPSSEPCLSPLDASTSATKAALQTCFPVHTRFGSNYTVEVDGQADSVDPLSTVSATTNKTLSSSLHTKNKRSSSIAQSLQALLLTDLQGLQLSN